MLSNSSSFYRLQVLAFFIKSRRISFELHSIDCFTFVAFVLVHCHFRSSGNASFWWKGILAYNKNMPQKKPSIIFDFQFNLDPSVPKPRSNFDSFWESLLTVFQVSRMSKITISTID